MKNKRKVCILIFSLLMMFIYKDNLSQTWISNDRVKFFEDKYIFDAVSNDSVYWFLCNDGLYNVIEDKIERYVIDNNSEGPLEKFKSDTSVYSNKFHNLVFKGSDLWMVAKNSDTVVRINNDIVQNYNVDTKGMENNYIMYFDIDGFNNLWLIYNDHKGITYQNDILGYDYYKMFRFDGKNFKEDSILKLMKDLNIISEPLLLINFFILDNDKYILYNDLISDSLKLLKIDIFSHVSDLTLCKNDESSIRYSSYSTNFYEYILGNTGDFYIIKNMEIIQKSKIPFKSLFLYNFVVKDNCAFIPSYQGLNIFNLKNESYSTIKPKDIDKDCFLGFKKVLTVHNNLLLIYGGIHYSNCPQGNKGIAFLNLGSK